MKATFRCGLPGYREGLCFQERRSVTESEGMGWIAIAAVAVVVLSALAGLLAVLVARERKTARRFQSLADVAAVSDAGGSLDRTLEETCPILVPDSADFCMIDVIGEDRVPRPAAVRVAPGGE